MSNLSEILKNKEYLKRMDPAELKYIIKILEGFCKFFEGTGVIDVEKCIQKVYEIYGPYYVEAQDRKKHESS